MYVPRPSLSDVEILNITYLRSIRAFQMCVFWDGTGKSADIHVIVKIESADSIPNLQSILDAADGVGFLFFILYYSGSDGGVIFFLESITVRVLQSKCLVRVEDYFMHV